MTKTPKCLEILGQLPDEFHARDYKELSGITYSSASGLIAHLVRQGHIERIAYGRYRKLKGAGSTPAVDIPPSPTPLSDDLSAVSSLFNDIAALIAENERLRAENAKLREESTWLAAEINRWAQIARAAKQIPIGRTACEH